MKKIILALFVLLTMLTSAAFALKFVFPKPQGYVSDYANLLNRDTRLRLENMGRTLEGSTGVEMAVVIVKTTLPYDYLEYANRLFANWQIGKVGQDNGVLLLVVLNEKKVRIETGYGIEEIIPDGKAGEILDRYVVPEFRENKYSEGVYNGALAIARAIGEHYNVQINGDYYPVPQPEDEPLDPFVIMVILIFLLLALSSRAGIFPWIFFGGFGTPYSGGSNSFGGGFGGFGGGMSGGGGASRSW